MSTREIVDGVYDALRHGDRDGLTALLDPDVEVWFTASLPAPIGGHHTGVDDCIDNGWWSIGALYKVQAAPEQYVAGDNGSLLVLGTYHGTQRHTCRAIEAAFAHHWTVAGDRITSIRQYTDSAAWLGVSA